MDGTGVAVSRDDLARLLDMAEPSSTGDERLIRRLRDELYDPDHEIRTIPRMHLGSADALDLPF